MLKGRMSRTTTPPFLLRLFYRQSTFHSPNEFNTVPPTSALAASSITIYTWPDCTLSELTSHVTSAIPDLLPSPAVGTRIGFRLIFPDTRAPGAEYEGRGRWMSKELGSVVIGEDVRSAHDGNIDADGLPDDGGDNEALGLGRLTGDANKTLADARFVIGDYVSCAIITPRQDGSIGSLPAGDRGGPRRAYDIGMNGHSRGGGFGRGRGNFGDRAYGPASNIPAGEWRRGERLPEGPRTDQGRRGGSRY
ncbi:Sin3 associated polypeptide p18-domain-containing protein [Elsinoe ampelina]|uniref:Sin3 associated polypeptide p18-domain-containing protein n=1 Tax=Elsinoe ampelina TaxID=302913 RepID=A0A6A6GAA9_9PEZI|nr:Sin3 associated polypeptide p18-domain-containing protein [Elsinoe ampelina]